MFDGKVGRPFDDSVDLSVSNRASSNGNSLAVEYKAGKVVFLPAVSTSVDQVSREETLLAKLCLHPAPRNSSSAPPSHFIQSFHSFMSIVSLRAVSKTLPTGLIGPRGVVKSKLAYKFLENITLSKDHSKGEMEIKSQ